MIKNIAWDTKEKKIAAIIFTFIVSGQFFFETMRIGYNKITDILLIALSAIVYSIFFITSVEGKWGRLFSLQGIISVATIVVSLGMAESYKVSTSTTEGIYAMLAVSLGLLMVQKIYLMPVAAAIGVFMALLTKQPLIQSTTMFLLPAAIGLSLICHSDKFKELAIWKIIILILSDIAMLAGFGYTIYCRIYTITLHSLITQVWDSIASAVAVVTLLVFAVATIIKRRSIVQIFGYIILALLGIIPMFMEMKYVLISAMSMFMVILFASKEGSPADELFNDIIGMFDPKNKGKSKSKSKKKKKA